MICWYYYDSNGKKLGPVDTETLKLLAKHGIITPDSIIETNVGHRGKAKEIEGLEFSDSRNSSEAVLAKPLVKSFEPSKVIIVQSPPKNKQNKQNKQEEQSKQEVQEKREKKRETKTNYRRISPNYRRISLFPILFVIFVMLLWRLSALIYFEKISYDSLPKILFSSFPKPFHNNEGHGHSSSNPLHVSINCQLEKHGGRVRAVAQTNLPDNTKIIVNVHSKYYKTQETCIVAGGQFTSNWFTNRGKSLTPGKYHVSFELPAYRVQESNVRQVLGTNYKNINITSSARSSWNVPFFVDSSE